MRSGVIDVLIHEYTAGLLFTRIPGHPYENSGTDVHNELGCVIHQNKETNQRFNVRVTVAHANVISSPKKVPMMRMDSTLMVMDPNPGPFV
jgi:ethanolamine utilization microcompartment shell protein EutL